jgi:hypothetical protein
MPSRYLGECRAEKRRLLGSSKLSRSRTFAGRVKKVWKFYDASSKLSPYQP